MLQNLFHLVSDLNRSLFEVISFSVCQIIIIVFFSWTAFLFDKSERVDHPQLSLSYIPVMYELVLNDRCDGWSEYCMIEWW